MEQGNNFKNMENMRMREWGTLEFFFFFKKRVNMVEEVKIDRKNRTMKEYQFQNVVSIKMGNGGYTLFQYGRQVSEIELQDVQQSVFDINM